LIDQAEAGGGPSSTGGVTTGFQIIRPRKGAEDTDFLIDTPGGRLKAYSTKIKPAMNPIIFTTTRA